MRKSAAGSGRRIRGERAAVRELFEAVTALARLYQFRDRDRICCRDMTVSQWYALEVLDRHGVCTVNALADELNLEKSTASRLVADLERKGYAKRQRNPGDGRSVLLRATAGGRRSFDTVRGELLREHTQVVSGLDAATQRTVAIVVRKLARATARRSGLSCAVTE
jgi:MarR family 2-MHQ and catechol resistance regulon transcriptional repressor